MNIQRGDGEAERATFDFRQGYVKIRDLGSRIKRYHAILWNGPRLTVSKKHFKTATEAGEYGHETRKRSRLLRGLFKKEENDDIHESDSD